MARNSPRLFLSPLPNSGSALVVAIWILAFFLILSAGLSGMVSSQVKLAERFRAKAVSQYLAHSACLYEASARISAAATEYDTLSSFKQQDEIELGNGSFSYTIIDEERKVNINIASGDIIGRLLEAATGLSGISAEELAKDILLYREKQLFRFKEELLHVEGITDEVFRSCKDFITIYGPGKVNMNTASAVVLEAIGLDKDTVKIIEEFRVGNDEEEFTEDDGYFENTDDILTKLRLFGLFTSQEIELLSVVNAMACVKSNNFSLEIETKVAGKKALTYSVLMDVEGKIKEWKEY